MFEMPVEKWSGAVKTVTLGATATEGGTRTSVVTVGGEASLPFLRFEGASPNRPVIAMEVWDEAPKGWPAPMEQAFGDVWGDPAAWAKRCVEQHRADMICLQLKSADPDGTNASPAEVAAKATAVKEAVGVPLIVWGCGDHAKDNDVIPAVSQALAGERCLLGAAVQDNYKTICACALADGHLIVNEAPLDINIQKQVNILVTDMGMPNDRIVMYQVTGGLGYGIEYAFSIMERTRLAALGGDAMLSMPMLAVVGSEAWKTKEAKVPQDEAPEWGPLVQRAIIWEAATATVFLHGGCNILVMWHPEAVAVVKKTIDALMA